MTPHDAPRAGDAINSPECLNRAQESTAVPRAKLTTRLDLLIDAETKEALNDLQAMWPNVTKSEIIREAILEKRKRDARKKKRNKTASG